LFGDLREISSFYTGLYWVIHHVAAFYSVVLIVVFQANLRFRSERTQITVLGMLLIGAFYSSLFASFTALVLGPMQVFRLGRRAWSTGAALWLTPMFLAPLFLYTNRVQKASLAWAPMHLGWFEHATLDGFVSSLSYLSLALVIDFAALPIFLFFNRSAFSPRERVLFWSSIAFFVSTGFVESIGYNNYSMRGMFLPTIVFFYLFARYCTAGISKRATRPVVYVVAALALIGTLREVAYMTYQPLQFSTWYWHATGREMPAQAKAVIRSEYGALARDSSVRYYKPDAEEITNMHKWNAEKLMQIPVAQMEPAEYELLRHPRRNWFW
jgi:hypothetical protein